jgi:large subunit ribosomal protein L47
MNRRPTTTIPKAATGTVKNLYEMTNYKADTRQYGQTGRAWRAEELRLKNHEDLHRLWYVLLKEKNKLKSDMLVSQQLQQMFYGFSELLKVRLSMSRLLTVVNERKKLRNEYRRHLEDEYIAGKKAEERAAKEAEAEKLKAQGIKVPMTEAEEKELLAKKAAKKQEVLKTAFDTLKSKSENPDVAVSPLINEADLKLLSTTQVNLS